MIMGKLFGTDGIRGRANTYPVTPEMAINVGRAVARIFKGSDTNPKIVVGKDTRISGDMLEYAIASGICSSGGDAYLTGILPTPGIAFTTSSMGANAGIVISASHNPYYDNGIKIFNGDGYKLSDEKEAEIEQLILDERRVSAGGSTQDTGSVYNIDDAGSRYEDFLIKTLSDENYFQGLKVVMDCSNGATSKIAPLVFSALGADVEALSINPDGKNINDNCGSQHPEVLQKKVVESGADIGVAFDGDGDRLIAVDEKGNVATGDQVLAVCAKYMKEKGLLKGKPVISTVMSNMGLGVTLKKLDIQHVTTKVGDRYVLERMISSGAALGGENSGHMIFLNHHTTGDGILAAIRLIEVVKAVSKPLSELCKIMTIFPQALINVHVQRKPDLNAEPAIQNAIKSIEASLGISGRVLVRYSGTRPLCRIMVEGPDIEITRRYCRQLSDIIENTIGK